jgi:2-C-methyl-D-erythritol 4-phosphate cytidylyltransferase
MSQHKHYWAIVPAAGIGSRMQADRPKQYLLLHGRPILEHTLMRLAAVPQLAGIVVCLAAHDDYWPRLNLPSHKIVCVPGGQERADSVRNALDYLHTHAHPQDWVLVHDAARPCVDKNDIQHLIQTVNDHAVGGLLALPVRDTMKRADSHGHVSATVSREGLWHALTPQMFRIHMLRHALYQAAADGVMVTDDAQALEYCGYHPLLVEGRADNIKITRPQDLALAHLYLQHTS